MAAERQVFPDTLNRRRPARILYHFGRTPDLDRRLRAHVGGDGDYGRRYGCFACVGVGPKRLAGLPPPDYGRYWAGEPLPPGTLKVHYHSDGNVMAVIPLPTTTAWGTTSSS